MRQVVEALTEKAAVIIDAPPLLPVTDAGLLTAAADGAILVTRVNVTLKEQVRLCTKLLDKVHGRLLGAVLNMTPKRSIGARKSGSASRRNSSWLGPNSLGSVTMKPPDGLEPAVAIA